MLPLWFGTIDLAKPLDLQEPDAERFLKHLQGNILKGHGRPFAAHIFLRFRESGRENSAIAQWLSDRASDQTITSAWSQLQGATVYRSRLPIDGGLFMMAALSATGYEKLNIPPEELPTQVKVALHQRREYRLDELFMNGMKMPARRRESSQNRRGGNEPRALFFRDPDPSEWDVRFRDDVDAMLILAHSDARQLEDLAQDLITTLREMTTVIEDDHGNPIEWGKALWRSARQNGLIHSGTKLDDSCYPIEHFGFHDGISNPLFTKEDIVRDAERRGNRHWRPEAPLSLVLRADSITGGETFGSFLVYRKLEQDVTGFRNDCETVAQKLRISPEMAGAMAVGRWENGKPFLSTEEPGYAGVDTNDFNFKDRNGNDTFCPFHAHIRKMNPRGTSNHTLDEEKIYRMARRGIPYDGSSPRQEGRRGDVVPNHVGLHFMSFQAHLDKFEAPMSRINSPGWPKSNQDWDVPQHEFVGVDPVAGTTDTNSAESMKPQVWKLPGKGPVESLFGNHVTLRGGEYFYAPSLTFLRKLKDIVPRSGSSG